MSFSPHDNKLQLKRRVPKGTLHRCWDFAFHANLLMYTQEIHYLRTKSKNKILKPLSQGSIWEANGANVRSMHFHNCASSSGGSWDGSSSNGKEKEARQRAPSQRVFPSLIFNGVTQQANIKRTNCSSVYGPLFVFCDDLEALHNEQSRFSRSWLL